MALNITYVQPVIDPFASLPVDKGCWDWCAVTKFAYIFHDIIWYPLALQFVLACAFYFTFTLGYDKYARICAHLFFISSVVSVVTIILVSKLYVG